MEVSKGKLKRVIREEVENVLEEQQTTNLGVSQDFPFSVFADDYHKFDVLRSILTALFNREIEFEELPTEKTQLFDPSKAYAAIFYTVKRGQGAKSVSSMGQKEMNKYYSEKMQKVMGAI